jgi:hypothetical protein
VSTWSPPLSRLVRYSASIRATQAKRVFISRVDPFLQVDGRFEDRGDDLLIDGRE